MSYKFLREKWISRKFSLPELPDDSPIARRLVKELKQLDRLQGENHQIRKDLIVNPGKPRDIIHWESNKGYYVYLNKKGEAAHKALVEDRDRIYVAGAEQERKIINLLKNDELKKDIQRDIDRLTQEATEKSDRLKQEANEKRASNDAINADNIKAAIEKIEEHIQLLRAFLQDLDKPEPDMVKLINDFTRQQVCGGLDPSDVLDAVENQQITLGYAQDKDRINDNGKSVQTSRKYYHRGSEYALNYRHDANGTQCMMSLKDMLRCSARRRKAKVKIDCAEFIARGHDRIFNFDAYNDRGNLDAFLFTCKQAYLRKELADYIDEILRLSTEAKKQAVSDNPQSFKTRFMIFDDAIKVLEHDIPAGERTRKYQFMLDTLHERNNRIKENNQLLTKYNYQKLFKAQGFDVKKINDISDLDRADLLNKVREKVQEAEEALVQAEKACEDNKSSSEHELQLSRDKLAGLRKELKDAQSQMSDVESGESMPQAEAPESNVLQLKRIVDNIQQMSNSVQEQGVDPSHRQYIALYNHIFFEDESQLSILPRTEEVRITYTDGRATIDIDPVDARKYVQAILNEFAGAIDELTTANQNIIDGINEMLQDGNADLQRINENKNLAKQANENASDLQGRVDSLCKKLNNATTTDLGKLCARAADEDRRAAQEDLAAAEQRLATLISENEATLAAAINLRSINDLMAGMPKPKNVSDIQYARSQDYVDLIEKDGELIRLRAQLKECLAEKQPTEAQNSISDLKQQIISRIAVLKDSVFDHDKAVKEAQINEFTRLAKSEEPWLYHVLARAVFQSAGGGNDYDQAFKLLQKIAAAEPGDSVVEYTWDQSGCKLNAEYAQELLDSINDTPGVWKARNAWLDQQSNSRRVQQTVQDAVDQARQGVQQAKKAVLVRSNSAAVDLSILASRNSKLGQQLRDASEAVAKIDAKRDARMMQVDEKNRRLWPWQSKMTY